jgi:hypothetical protein
LRQPEAGTGRDGDSDLSLSLSLSLHFATLSEVHKQQARSSAASFLGAHLLVWRQQQVAFLDDLSRVDATVPAIEFYLPAAASRRSRQTRARKTGKTVHVPTSAIMLLLRQGDAEFLTLALDREWE